jgi:hypothetical protein
MEWAVVNGWKECCCCCSGCCCCSSSTRTHIHSPSPSIVSSAAARSPLLSVHITHNLNEPVSHSRPTRWNLPYLVLPVMHGLSNLPVRRKLLGFQAALCNVGMCACDGSVVKQRAVWSDRSATCHQTIRHDDRRFVPTHVARALRSGAAMSGAFCLWFGSCCYCWRWASSLCSMHCSSSCCGSVWHSLLCLWPSASFR